MIVVGVFFFAGTLFAVLGTSSENTLVGGSGAALIAAGWLWRESPRR
jgi:hypothetical protein